MNNLEYPEQEIKKAWDDLKYFKNPKLEEELMFAQDFFIYIHFPEKSPHTLEISRQFNKGADELGLKSNNFAEWWESRKQFYSSKNL